MKSTGKDSNLQSLPLDRWPSLVLGACCQLHHPRIGSGHQPLPESIGVDPKVLGHLLGADDSLGSVVAPLVRVRLNSTERPTRVFEPAGIGSDEMSSPAFNPDNRDPMQIEISMERSLAPLFRSLFFELDYSGLFCERLGFHSQLGDLRRRLFRVLQHDSFLQGTN